MAEKLDATFFAFRKREKSGVLMSATLLYIVITAALLAVFLYLNWNSLGETFAWIAEVARLGEQAQTNPELMPTPPPSLYIVFGAYLLLAFPIYVALAAYEAACLRWLAKGETGGVLGFTLGADTWRCYGGYWVWFLLTMGAAIAITLIGGVLAGVIWSGGATAEQRELAEAPFHIIALYFWLRLAPANATSVGVGQFSFFKAWTVTRERTAALLGSYVIVGLLYLALVCAVSAVGYFTLWPSIASLSANGPNEDWSEITRVYSEAFASTQFAVTACALAALVTIAGLFLYIFHFGICARAVLVALEEGKIERAANT